MFNQSFINNAKRTIDGLKAKKDKYFYHETVLAKLLGVKKAWTTNCI